jgi:hypothetical protein
MGETRRIRGLSGLQQAFDEVRFGASRTLNLRASRPAGAEAARRLDAWLRQQQALGSAEVLVITGRGNNSDGGVAVVRDASMRVLRVLQRARVVEAFAEHTPGSFVVSLLPLQSSTRRAAPQGDTAPPPADPPTLSALDDTTRHRLRVLAERSLDALGVRDRTRFVEAEMVRLFGDLAARAGSGPDREARLRAAIEVAMSALD